MQTVFAQADSIDTKLQTILVEKNDDTRMDNLYIYLNSVSERDPILTQTISQRILTLSEKNKYKLAEAFAISQLGYLNFTIGNVTKGLEYALKALKMAEPLNNYTLIAIVKNRLALNYSGIDEQKHIETLQQAIRLADNAKQAKVFIAIAYNLGKAFTSANKLDSALEYLQLSDKLSQRLVYETSSSFIYTYYGTLYAKMKNPALATTYFYLALSKANESKFPRQIALTNSTIAKYYYENNQLDSCVFYAKKAIDAIKNTAFASRITQPANLLMTIYKNKNNDSAMKYAELYIKANDSTNSLKTMQQTFLMSFEEDLRQKEMKQEKQEANEQRNQNIQYALIAIGIVTFLILFFLLSRSIIVNEKWISFFGILGLLIVFEFINLLIHPFLERVTHHNPMLMLLALVALASLLVPLHHRVEKWVKVKMTEKNKSIRLASAKKTIEELEKKG